MAACCMSILVLTRFPVPAVSVRRLFGVNLNPFFAPDAGLALLALLHKTPLNMSSNLLHNVFDKPDPISQVVSRFDFSKASLAQ